MSYERALEAMRGAAGVAPPGFLEVEAARRWSGSPDIADEATIRKVRWGLRAAMLGFVGMAVSERFGSPSLQGSGRTIAVLIPLLTLVLANRLVSHRHLGHQMLVRAFAWSTLVIGVLVAGWDFAEFRGWGIPIACGAGLALYWLHDRGLGVTSRSFRPAAFRGHLLIALVMAFADAQTLGFGALVQLTQRRIPWIVGEVVAQAGPALLSGIVMAVAVWGIYRLRTWALLLNVVANLVIAAAALHGWLNVTLPVAAALASTAAIQLFLPVPIIAAAFGDEARDRAPLGRLGGPVVRGVLWAMMLVAIVGAPAFDSQHGWADRTYTTGFRGLGVFRAVDLSHADRDGEDFRGRSLFRARLVGTELRGANLTAARLGEADLEDAVLDGAMLVRVRAAAASFRGATLVGADLRGALLTDASFTGADLRQANLRGVLAIGARMDGADLRYADLEGAVMPGALAARLEHATCPDGTSAGAAGDCVAHMGTLSPQLATRLGASAFVLGVPGESDTTWTMRIDGDYLVLRDGDAPYLARDERHYFRSAPTASTVELVIDGDVLMAVELDGDSAFPRRLAVVRPAQ